MSVPTATSPRVTILMIARERYALTEAALESVVANTPQPYRLIYCDGQTPEWLWQRLEQRASEWNLELVRFNQHLWPNQLRNHVLNGVTSEYMVCMDNDVMVQPGWLPPLVACADETGAGIVGPLYLWGDGTRSVIHMAGGYLTHTATPEGNILTQTHAYENVPLENLPQPLTRTPCDNVEYHCMMIRTSALRQAGGFDESIPNVHKHIDIALEIKRQGLAIYLEPASQVNFLHYAPYRLEDLPPYRYRWAKAPIEESIAAFCKKWQVIDHPTAFEGVRRFLAKLLAEVDPLRSQLPPTAATIMPAQALQQACSGLLDQAEAAGFTAQEIKHLADGYALAQSATNGGYRPCGRPFVNHLVGTASIMLYYGCKLENILAGLLHNIYTHAPHYSDGKEAGAATLARCMGGRGSSIETRVRAYSLYAEHAHQWKTQPLRELSLLNAEILLIAAANEIDMRLSGEVRHSGRDSILPANFMQQLKEVCDIIGIPGLAMTLEQLNHPTPPASLPTGITHSYRLLASGQKVPMRNHLLL